MIIIPHINIVLSLILRISLGSFDFKLMINYIHYILVIKFQLMDNEFNCFLTDQINLRKVTIL